MSDTSSEFKPGQTVWQRHTHEMFDIVAVKGPSCWCWSVERCHYETISADDLLATDPNQPAEPVPQNCPWCGCDAEILACKAYRGFIVQCGSIDQHCFFSGSRKPTRLEAVQAWNSISILSVPAKTPKTSWQDLGKMLVAQEREACAVIADLAAQECGEGYGGMILANGIASAIRKRGQP